MKTTSLILVCLIVFVAFVGAGCQASQAEPTPLALDAIVTVEDFQRRIAEIEQADTSQAQGLADSLWQALTAQGRAPLVFGERVFFLYKGAANSVTWRGDFTGWESGPGVEGKRIGGSDLWMAETTLPVDARANYKIVLDGQDWILDPANPRVQPGGLGDNNILAMPEFAVTTDTARRNDVAPGTLSDDLTIESTNLGYAVNYRVYTPANYDDLSGLPVVYVTDGNDWVYEPYGAMAVALDNLIADGRIEPVMAVFIDAREPGNPENNRREQEFLDHFDPYARFVAEELVPAIDLHELGDSSLGRRRPERYGGQHGKHRDPHPRYPDSGKPQLGPVERPAGRDADLLLCSAAGARRGCAIGARCRPHDRRHRHGARRLDGHSVLADATRCGRTGHHRGWHR